MKALADLRIEFPLKTLHKVCLEKLANRLKVFAVLRTGYGKSLLYAILPKLMLGVEDNLQCAIVLVILPLILKIKNTAWSLFSSERSMTAYGITLG